MADAQIDWQNKYFEDSSTQVLLNPQMSLAEQTALQKLALRFNKPGHVWIASSGSSSNSQQSTKLIALSKKAILSSARAVNQHLQVNQKDIWAQVLPLFHVGGLGIQARAYLSQSTIVSGLDAQNSWDARHFYDVLNSRQVTLTALVPTQVYDLVKLNSQCPKNLRAIIVGGAALSDELYQQARKLGWPLLPSFGMTECCSQIATAKLSGLSDHDRGLYVLSHLKVRVSDRGLLEVSGESLLTGYAQIKNGQEVFVDPKVNGWLETSDRGTMQKYKQEDIINPEGRSEDFVKILGEGVSLSKLDQILSAVLQELKIKNAEQFALVAMPDERAGARIVLLLSDIDTEAKSILDLIRHFDQKVNPYEKIKEHHFVKEIPRSSLGKLQRQKLLEQFIRG